MSPVLQWGLAVLHLLGLPLALGSIAVRAGALRELARGAQGPAEKAPVPSGGMAASPAGAAGPAGALQPTEALERHSAPAADRSPGPAAPLKRVFTADSLWGLSALLLISTGLLRAFAGFEKGSGYYVHNVLFWHKMAFLALILVLEIRPMVTLVRWRVAERRGAPVDTASARGLARISVVQAALVVAMVLAASGMARGFGVPG